MITYNSFHYHFKFRFWFSFYCNFWGFTNWRDQKIVYMIPDESELREIIVMIIYSVVFASGTCAESDPRILSAFPFNVIFHLFYSFNIKIYIFDLSKIFKNFQNFNFILNVLQRFYTYLVHDYAYVHSSQNYHVLGHFWAFTD